MELRSVINPAVAAVALGVLAIVLVFTIALGGSNKNRPAFYISLVVMVLACYIVFQLERRSADLAAEWQRVQERMWQIAPKLEELGRNPALEGDPSYRTRYTDLLKRANTLASVSTLTPWQIILFWDERRFVSDFQEAAKRALQDYCALRADIDLGPSTLPLLSNPLRVKWALLARAYYLSVVAPPTSGQPAELFELASKLQESSNLLPGEMPALEGATLPLMQRVNLNRAMADGLNARDASSIQQ